MRLQVKFLGVIYCGFGWLVGLLVALLVLMQVLTSLGVMKDDGKSPGLYGALSIGVLLMTVAWWFFLTGRGLWYFNAMSRVWALIIGGVLLLGLNVALILTKDLPRTSSTGMTVFHLTCITLGLYTLALLWPKWGRRLFESSDEQKQG